MHDWKARFACNYDYLIPRPSQVCGMYVCDDFHPIVALPVMAQQGKHYKAGQENSGLVPIINHTQSTELSAK